MHKIDRNITWSAAAAERVAEQVHVIGGAFNELTQIVSDDLPPDQQVEVRRVLGEMMGSLFVEILVPIENKFPHLRKDP
ncbi:MAG TPA: hypothetical protein VEA80_20155 [Vitreimonas sp.]|uniref:hypothetical protein n=1 Tax=Vitreimonas sp. TaxID=3069702 RepID=UPI002D6E7709|nr:hypothetical protein [Vitreimonas sp.]HYD89804.1 hypothetical protein [Vitreimonas sp.]